MTALSRLLAQLPAILDAGSERHLRSFVNPSAG